MTGLQFFAPGEAIPGPTHSVSVSLPDVASVVGFESGDAATLSRIPGGYPRFRTHALVAGVAAHVRQHLAAASGEDLILTRSIRSARAAAVFAGVEHSRTFDFEGACGLALEPTDSRADAARTYVMHTGGHMTSRQAEDLLLAAGLVEYRSPEQTAEAGAEEQITSVLLAAYGAGGPEDISLHNSGMNAVYTAIASLHAAQRSHGRRVWVQLGGIFFDTVAILHKGIVDCEHVKIPGPFAMEALEALVRERGSDLAGIVAEVPSNPLIQTPDVAWLRRLADQAGCALVLDATIATPYNVDVLGWSDIVCESLTKYASGSADVLMGAAIVNRRSRFAETLRAGLGDLGERPYQRDAARVAHRIVGYRDRIRAVNANTMEAARFFTESRAVRRVYWAYEKESAANYERIQRQPDAPGGLLMLDLKVPLERVYDPLRCAKGPSFGWDGTMAAAQVFIAHFDLLETAAGRAELAAHGLHRDMLRVSMGIEDIDSILSVFEEALRWCD